MSENPLRSTFASTTAAHTYLWGAERMGGPMSGPSTAVTSPILTSAPTVATLNPTGDAKGARRYSHRAASPPASSRGAAGAAAVDRARVVVHLLSTAALADAPCMESAGGGSLSATSVPTLDSLSPVHTPMTTLTIRVGGNPVSPPAMHQRTGTFTKTFTGSSAGAAQGLPRSANSPAAAREDIVAYTTTASMALAAPGSITGRAAAQEVARPPARGGGGSPLMFTARSDSVLAGSGPATPLASDVGDDPALDVGGGGGGGGCCGGTAVVCRGGSAGYVASSPDGAIPLQPHAAHRYPRHHHHHHCHSGLHSGSLPPSQWGSTSSLRWSGGGAHALSRASAGPGAGPYTPWDSAEGTPCSPGESAHMGGGGAGGGHGLPGGGGYGLVASFTGLSRGCPTTGEVSLASTMQTSLGSTGGPLAPTGAVTVTVGAGGRTPLAPGVAPAAGAGPTRARLAPAGSPVQSHTHTHTLPPALSHSVGSGGYAAAVMSSGSTLSCEAVLHGGSGTDAGPAGLPEPSVPDREDVVAVGSPLTPALPTAPRQHHLHHAHHSHCADLQTQPGGTQWRHPPTHHHHHHHHYHHHHHHHHQQRQKQQHVGGPARAHAAVPPTPSQVASGRHVTGGGDASDGLAGGPREAGSPATCAPAWSTPSPPHGPAVQPQLSVGHAGGQWVGAVDGDAGVGASAAARGGGPAALPSGYYRSADALTGFYSGGRHPPIISIATGEVRTYHARRPSSPTAGAVSRAARPCALTGGGGVEGVAGVGPRGGRQAPWQGPGQQRAPLYHDVSSTTWMGVGGGEGDVGHQSLLPPPPPPPRPQQQQQQQQPSSMTAAAEGRYDSPPGPRNPQHPHLQQAPSQRGGYVACYGHSDGSPAPPMTITVGGVVVKPPPARMAYGEAGPPRSLPSPPVGSSSSMDSSYGYVPQPRDTLSPLSSHYPHRYLQPQPHACSPLLPPRQQQQQQQHPQQADAMVGAQLQQQQQQPVRMIQRQRRGTTVVIERNF